MTESQVGMPGKVADDSPGRPEPAHQPIPPRRVTSRVIAYGVLPGLALALAIAAAWLKWQDSSERDAGIIRAESAQAAKDATIALLCYRPDTVDSDVAAAQQRLTGSFRDIYAQVSRDVVIPNAKERHISAGASVPAVASVSATENHAVVLVFVDQTLTAGTSPPADATTSARVTLDKVGGRWLVSLFETV